MITFPSNELRIIVYQAKRLNNLSFLNHIQVLSFQITILAYEWLEFIQSKLHPKIWLLFVSHLIFTRSFWNSYFVCSIFNYFGLDLFNLFSAKLVLNIRFASDYFLSLIIQLSILVALKAYQDLVHLDLTWEFARFLNVGCEHIRLVKVILIVGGHILLEEMLEHKEVVRLENQFKFIYSDCYCLTTPVRLHI